MHNSFFLRDALLSSILLGELEGIKDETEKREKKIVKHKRDGEINGSTSLFLLSLVLPSFCLMNHSSTSCSFTPLIILTQWIMLKRVY